MEQWYRILFTHIADLFYGNQEFALYVLPKLSLDHIVFTPYSKMKVKLATQVLNNSVAIALKESGNKEVLSTAQFCWFMNHLFDCANIQSLTEHIKKGIILSNHSLHPMMNGSHGTLKVGDRV